MLVKHSGCNWKTPSYRGFSLFMAIVGKGLGKDKGCFLPFSYGEIVNALPAAAVRELEDFTFCLLQ